MDNTGEDGGENGGEDGGEDGVEVSGERERGGEYKTSIKKKLLFAA